MRVGIAGLGLIGGSFARAYSAVGHEVYALEKDAAILDLAYQAQAIQGVLTKENAASCDLILVCVYPLAAISFLQSFGPSFGSIPIVIDCCGTKRQVTTAGMAEARKDGFTFLGGHPMAGTHFSGFDHSCADLFQGAPMVLVPPEGSDPALINKARWLLSPAGFGSISVTTAEDHDRIIAFTSQLAHVVSNAYVKSPSAQVHRGFSAGSYKDLTRVAWLNPEMWAELFLENRDYLMEEIDILIHHLQEYRSDLDRGDREDLVRLLAEGRDRKEKLDG